MGKHGMVRVADTHFEYEDGTLYFPFGTTIYALAHQEEALIEQTFASLAQSPFNKVRMCVFPKHYQYNQNEPKYLPFEKRADGSWDTAKPVEAFWNHLEQVIRRLDEMEIECDLILFHSYDHWGFASMSQADNLAYLEYCLKRLGDCDNVWWSLANEYDLMLASISMEQWYEIEEFVASHNPRGHLLSNHNCFRTWDMGRPNITHGSYQVKYLSYIADRIMEHHKPICVDECCYEGNLPEAWGNLSGEEMVARFWMAIASGAYCTHGETFLDDNDIVWWAKGGRLKGKSPERIAFLRRIVESFGAPMMPYKAAPFEFLDNLPDEVKANFEGTVSGRSFPLALAQADPDEQKVLDIFEHEYTGRTEDQTVLLKYLYQRCGARDYMNLPEGKEYRVEVIDTWNMTRTTVHTHATGRVTVDLPGKPYMAILATAM